MLPSTMNTQEISLLYFVKLYIIIMYSADTFS